MYAKICIKYQKLWISLALALLGAGSALTVKARAPEDLGGGSGEVPTPLITYNQKVELADGEPYTLLGKIHIVRGQAYFEVDLEEHPWLANTKRKASPFYPLLGTAAYWSKFEGQNVKVVAEAQGQVEAPTQTEPKHHYVISLQPLADPVTLSEQPEASSRSQR